MKFEIIAIGEVEPDFVSRCIQRFSKANYSHIAILLDDCILYEAVGEGVRKSSVAEMMAVKPHAIRRRVELPVKSECCSLTWLEANVGKKYGLIQYLGFLFPFLRWLPFVKNGKREVVCSEFGADFVMCCTKLGHIAEQAYGTGDWVLPPQAMDVAAGLYGEMNTHLPPAYKERLDGN